MLRKQQLPTRHTRVRVNYSQVIDICFIICPISTAEYSSYMIISQGGNPTSQHDFKYMFYIFTVIKTGGWSVYSIAAAFCTVVS